MARLPQPGGDNGNWGNILNDFLAQAHKSDGTIKDDAITAAQLAPGAVTKSDVGLGNVDNTSDTDKPVSTAAQTALDAKLSTPSGTPSGTKFLRDDNSWQAVPAAADATTSAKGIVQLAGDLSGTAAAPTIPALGTRVTGVKGGKAAILYRRDFPHAIDADATTTLSITESVTQNSTSTTIASGAGLAFMPSGKLAATGGATLHVDGSQANSYKFDWKYPVNGGSPASYPWPNGWAVQFDTMGTQYIEFLVYARTGYAWNLFVDGKRVWDVPRTTTLTANAQNLIKFDLSNNGPHTIRFEMNSMSLRTIFGEPAGTYWSSPPRGPRVFFLGDSLTQGASQSTGGELGSWINRFGHMCGFEDVWNGGIGSTGPIADNGSTFASYVTRATTDVVPSNADIVFVSSYYNDRAQSAGDIATAFTNTINAIRAMSTPPQIYVSGTYDPLGSNGSPYNTIDAAVLAACTALGVPYIEPRTGNVYDGAGNQLAPNGGSGAWITNGNKATMIGGDNVHQTDAGQKYMAYRMYEAFRLLLPV